MKPDEMEIGRRRIGIRQTPFVVAEVGVNHDGNPDRALELVRAAAASGADAVKFQWFRADQLVGDPSSTAEYQRRSGFESQLDLLRGLELDRDSLEGIVAEAHRLDIAAIVSVFSVDAVPEASSLPWDAWKTASPDVVHRPLLEALAADGRPLIVSTGGATLDEIVRADEWLSGIDIGFLHCVSAYPTPLDQANLAAIRTIAEATSRPGGYSDHTSDIMTGGIAVAAGAAILEKHLTWSRTADGPDHSASLEPEALKRYIEFTRTVHTAMGSGDKKRSKIEGDVMSVARQSIRAVRPLGAGTLLQRSDLVVKRPGDGLEPWRVEEVVGRTLQRDLGIDEPVRLEDLR